VAPAYWAMYFERLTIVALILIALYVLGRKMRELRIFASTSRRLRVVESVALSPNAALHIVQADRRYFLIGSGNGGVTRVAVLRHEACRDKAEGTS
jgi:flagellar biogenesis protein FliO